MNRGKKFGRRLNLPSTTAIKHELVMMGLVDKMTASLRSNGISLQEFKNLIKECTDENDISPEKARIILGMHLPLNATVIAAAGASNSEAAGQMSSSD